jgi:hypothetical protein
MKTWMVVIETENSLHRNWFDNPENNPKFKESFRIHIQNILPNNLDQPCP